MQRHHVRDGPVVWAGVTHFSWGGSDLPTVLGLDKFAAQETKNSKPGSWRASGRFTSAVDQRLPDGKTSGIYVAEVSMRLHELAEKEKPPGCLRG
jgi:hypothetical protein